MHGTKIGEAASLRQRYKLRPRNPIHGDMIPKMALYLRALVYMDRDMLLERIARAIYLGDMDRKCRDDDFFLDVRRFVQDSISSKHARGDVA
jgi:hypothetical protein